MPMDSLQNEENVYAAEALMKDRKRKGKIEYLVKWKGWGAKHNSWEPRENILDERLFAEYDARKNKKNERKRSSGSSSNKAPPSKRPRRLAGGDVNEESDEDEDFDDPDEDTPAPSPSASKGKQKRTPKSGKKEKEEPTEKVISEKKTEAKPPEEESAVAENGGKLKEEGNKVEDAAAETELSEEPVKESPKSAKQTSEKSKESAAPKCAPQSPEEKANIASTSKTELPQVIPAKDSTEGGESANKEEKEELKKPSQSPEEAKSALEAPKVYYGHMTSIQIASSSNGHEQLVSTNAFVVSPPGASGSTEQMQVCDSEDLARIQAIKNDLISDLNDSKNWTDGNNIRKETYQYNGSQSITEVTVNQQTVPFLEI